MANRIIRESICTSETIDVLSMGAEVTFYRMLVCVDDYGRIDARPKLLKSKLYPIKDISLEEFTGYLDELYQSGLIWGYAVAGKSYIQVSTWDQYQQVRNKRSKYPAPDPDAQRTQPDINCLQVDINCNQVTADQKQLDSNCSQSDALNPYPYPNPNPNPYPDPNPDAVDARAREIDTGETDTTTAAASTPVLGESYTSAELIAEQTVQACADQLVRSYGLAYTPRNLDELSKDIRQHGEAKVRAAFEAAADSDHRGGMSLKYYRTFLSNGNGGHGLPGRDSPGIKHIHHSETEWSEIAAAAIVNLDED